MFIKRSLLSSQRDCFDHQQRHHHHQMMMGGHGVNGGGVARPAPTSILHLPFPYDESPSSSCDLSLAFARLQQRINQQGQMGMVDQGSELGSGSSRLVTSSIDSLIGRGNGSFAVDSFRDGMTYVDNHEELNNTSNNNSGMNSFFHNLNLSYGLVAEAARNGGHDQNISSPTHEEKPGGGFDHLQPYELDSSGSTTGCNISNGLATTPVPAVLMTTSSAMNLKQESSLPWGGFPWQVIKGTGDQGGINMVAAAGDPDQIGEFEKNWINVNGRLMNVGNSSPSWHGLLNTSPLT